MARLHLMMTVSFHSPTIQDDPKSHQNGSPQLLAGTAQVSGLVTQYGKLFILFLGRFRLNSPLEAGQEGTGSQGLGNEWRAPQTRGTERAKEVADSRAILMLINRGPQGALVPK